MFLVLATDITRVTCGGVNGPICHGAGRQHKTLSDQVRMIEYVDANGVHQQVSDPALLKAAAGCFGLLGVVTHVTLEVDPMSYAVMAPRKPDVGLAIPPLQMSDIPKALQKTWTDAEIANALADFEHRAETNYYSEWFWFTYQSTAWVNTWNTTTSQDGVSDYPSPFETWLQWVEDWLAGVVTTTPFFQSVPGYWQAQFLATLGMAFLPPTLFQEPNPTIKTYLPDALHFRRGVSTFLNSTIPVPSLKSRYPLEVMVPSLQSWCPHYSHGSFPELMLTVPYRSRICASETWNSKFLFHLSLPTIPSPTTLSSAEPGGTLSISSTPIQKPRCG